MQTGGIINNEMNGDIRSVVDNLYYVNCSSTVFLLAAISLRRGADAAACITFKRSEGV